VHSPYDQGDSAAHLSVNSGVVSIIHQPCGLQDRKDRRTKYSCDTFDIARTPQWRIDTTQELREAGVTITTASVLMLDQAGTLTATDILSVWAQAQTMGTLDARRKADGPLVTTA
jgi:hypothetical protein